MLMGHISCHISSISNTSVSFLNLVFLFVSASFTKVLEFNCLLYANLLMFQIYCPTRMDNRGSTVIAVTFSEGLCCYSKHGEKIGSSQKFN